MKKLEIKWKNFFWSQKLVARWSISNSLKQFRPELDWWYIWCNMIYSYYVIIIFMYIVCIVEKYFSLNFLFRSPIQDPHTWNLIFQLSVSRKRKREKFSCESLHMRECQNWNRWSTHTLSSLWAFCIMYFAIHPSQHFVYFYSVHYLHKLNFRLVYIFNSDHTTT